MDTIIKPETASQRINSLDILRGFALLGIVLVNSLGFNASFFNFGGFYGSLSDSFQQKFYNIFISLSADKFIFLFSFLFGYGIYLQYKKFNDNMLSFGSFFSRRMILLALFGLFHVVFLWAGDILLPYSIAGLIIFILRKLPTSAQILISLFFYFFISIWIVVSKSITLPDAMTSACTECLEQAKIIYSNGNYFEIMQLRLQEYISFRNINLFYYLPKIIGISLFGFAMSRLHFHQKIANNKGVWIIVLFVIATISTIVYFNYDKIVDFNSPYANAVFMFGYEFMNLFVASTYMLFILLISSFSTPAKLLKPFGLMGRMSLTNYLTQSLILSVIFYGWGFGMFGQTEITKVLLIAIIVFAIQIIANVIWFKYYELGPMEKIWRRWSYKTKKV